IGHQRGFANVCSIFDFIQDEMGDCRPGDPSTRLPAQGAHLVRSRLGGVGKDWCPDNSPLDGTMTDILRSLPFVVHHGASEELHQSRQEYLATGRLIVLTAYTKGSAGQPKETGDSF